MKLPTPCQGLLLDSLLRGYGTHRRTGETVGRFQHTSFGALYPAHSKLLAADLVQVDQTRTGDLGMKADAITDVGREGFDAKLIELTKLDLF